MWSNCTTVWCTYTSVMLFWSWFPLFFRGCFSYYALVIPSPLNFQSDEKAVCLPMINSNICHVAGTNKPCIAYVYVWARYMKFPVCGCVFLDIAEFGVCACVCVEWNNEFEWSVIMWEPSCSMCVLSVVGVVCGPCMWVMKLGWGSAGVYGEGLVFAKDCEQHCTWWSSSPRAASCRHPPISHPSPHNHFRKWQLHEHK